LEVKREEKPSTRSRTHLPPRPLISQPSCPFGAPETMKSLGSTAGGAEGAEIHFAQGVRTTCPEISACIAGR
jgi:hypothetical protein